MAALQVIETLRKTGSETFLCEGRSTSANLLSFWQWSSSDLIGNTDRGVLAEFIVGTELGVTRYRIRKGWDAFDLQTPEGIKVEVKSGAYIQSWKQEKYSVIQFGIQPTFAWYPETNTFSDEKRRHADVYVFSVLSHKDQDSINPLNLDQWNFYVLATNVLNRSVGAQKTITLSSLKKLKPAEVRYGEIYSTIKKTFL
jgi:hypothetical protein